MWKSIERLGKFRAAQFVSGSSFFLEVFYSYAAGGAEPAFGEIFKCRSWWDSVFRVSLCRIVDVSAENTYISVHNVLVL